MLNVIEEKSNVLSDATARVIVESDLSDFQMAQAELIKNSWDVAREWAHSKGISGPGRGGSGVLAPYAVNQEGEEITDKHYSMPANSPERQPAAFRVDVDVHGKTR